MRIKGQEMFVFRKIWHILFSYNIHFEIRPFALLQRTDIQLRFPVGDMMVIVKAEVRHLV